MTSIAATPSLRPVTPTAPTAPAAPAAPDVDPFDPRVIADRVAAGRRAEASEGHEADELIGRAGAPKYFRTYEQVKAAMYDLQQAYPQLVEVRDIGDSAEKVAGLADRDILALVITNKATGAIGTKPATMHVGGIHAREIANPEMLMTFAKELLEGHGRTPEATMVVDSRETILVPMLNPDGHAVVERGFAGEKNGNVMQRKSTMGGEPSRGTDLNRNFDFHWGGPGASAGAWSDIYRGPSAGSEPETQAIQRYLSERKPKFFVDWHSYSKLNMYPWGDTREHTKDQVGFDAMARKMTTYNGYSPMQSIELYPTTGTTDDYAYGVHGVPAMVVETGSSFLQPDSEYADTVAKNLPILRYVTRAADAPLERVLGPDALDVTVDQATHQVTARLTDANNGKQALAGAELVTDPAAAPGTGVALQPADGTFDSVEEAVTGTASVTNAAAGQLVYVRGRDAAGNWGPLTPQWLTGPAQA